MSDAMTTPNRLGRGLSALFGEYQTGPGGAAATGGSSQTFDGGPGPRGIPIDLIRRNPHQPRRDFSEHDMESLTASIREKGVLQPILVRPMQGPSELYEIVAGERRWRAAQRAGLTAVPALIRPIDDLEMLEIAIIENVQRADLNAIEEAEAYAQLQERWGRTQEQVAEVVGKSREHIANLLRLLKLPQDVRTLVKEGRLSAGHARALVTAPDPMKLASDIIERKLSVRQAEDLAAEARAETARDLKTRIRTLVPEQDADTRALATDLSNALGMMVDIKHRSDSGGEVKITYRSLEQLDEICRRLSQR
jgi:ParB family chromosome partitioning protein